MKVNGTLMNYYFHCKRQCYLFGNRMNMEDNSEEVKIGRAIHEERAEQSNTEIAIENIRLDKLTAEYLTEVKKSDADVEASKWQLIFYLKVLKEKGISRKGNYCLLNEEGRKIFIEAFEGRLESVFQHPILKRKITYRTAIKLDCYKLIKEIMEDKEFIPFSLKGGC